MEISPETMHSANFFDFSGQNFSFLLLFLRSVFRCAKPDSGQNLLERTYQEFKRIYIYPPSICHRYSLPTLSPSEDTCIRKSLICINVQQLWLKGSLQAIWTPLRLLFLSSHSKWADSINLLTTHHHTQQYYCLHICEKGFED